MNKEVREVTEEAQTQAVCQFCHVPTINSLELGPMYQLDGVTVHYFCMLFSAGLSQNGEDEDGILGFLPQDIRKEIKRGEKLRCKFCRKNNATIGCSVRSCKSSYHFPCGLQHKCAFHFIGNFESYCPKHKTEVDIPLDPNAERDCPICFSDVPDDETPLWPPCCRKRLFHKLCIMTMAKTHGKHFFKCPLCNDKDIFSVAMRKSGVYLPDRDAAWETEPNAYADHARVHNRCDAVTCHCPSGREHSEKPESNPWKIIRCGSCGAFATHKSCSNLKNLTWRCPTCEDILSDKRKTEMLNSSRIQRPCYDALDDEEESVELQAAPVQSVRDGIMESSLPCTNRTSSSSSSTSSSSEMDEDDEDKTKTIFDPRYGRQFLVNSSEGSSGSGDDEQDENQEGDLNATPSTLDGSQSGKTSATASLSRSSEEIIYPDNVSQPVRTSSLGNIPAAPKGVSLPPLAIDKVISGGSTKYVKGRVEVAGTSEIVSGPSSQIVKISSNSVHPKRSYVKSSSKNSKGREKAAEERENKLDSTKTEDDTTGVAPASPTPDNKLNSNQPITREELSVIHVGKPEPKRLPVVDLDEESSGSDLEVVGEILAPKSSSSTPKLPAIMLNLLNKKREWSLPVRNPTLPKISTAFLQMIQREKNARSGRRAESKNENFDPDIVDLDSDDGLPGENITTTRDNRQGEGPTEKNKRESMCSSSEPDLSQASSSKRARK